jgi:peptide/nickel transport system permease protein
MIYYIIKRMLMIVPVIIGVSFIVFVLVYLCPGDAADRTLQLSQTHGVSEMRMEEYLALKHTYGLDQPWYIQYFYWLKNFFKGDLGYSFSTGMSVTQEIFARVPNTLIYQAAAIFLSVAIAIPAGVISAVKRNSRTDTYVVMGSLAGASFPPFVTGLLLIYLFSLTLGWLPTSGAHSWEFAGRTVPHDLAYYIDYLKHLILPTFTLAIVNIGYLTRLVRSSMLNVLKEDYVFLARSKGLKERVVIYKHALKNAILPIVTVLGVRVALMISGAPIIETIFSWPGVGRYFVHSVFFRDYFSVIGASLILGIFILIMNLIIDISYTFLDPRIKV